MKNKLKIYQPVHLHHSIVTDVLLKNGKTTQIITIFNAIDIEDDYINIGITKALEFSHRADKMKSNFCSFKKGKLKTIAEFEETKIKEYSPENDPDLNKNLQNEVNFKSFFNTVQNRLRFNDLEAFFNKSEQASEAFRKIFLFVLANYKEMNLTDKDLVNFGEFFSFFDELKTQN